MMIKYYLQSTGYVFYNGILNFFGVFLRFPAEKCFPVFLVTAKSEHSQVPLLDRSAPFMEDIVVTKEGVTKLLKGLSPSKALGPDELHPRVLKELATELGPVFAHLFQQSIDKGEIPKHLSTVQKGR